MCKIGDIIVVDKYISEDNKEMNRHSFVVIEDTKGNIGGINYDIVTNVMSSFKNESHRKRKLKYKENLEIKSRDIIANYKNKKIGYIKADQLIYFDKKKKSYFVAFRHDLLKIS